MSGQQQPIAGSYAVGGSMGAIGVNVAADSGNLQANSCRWQQPPNRTDQLTRTAIRRCNEGGNPASPCRGTNGTPRPLRAGGLPSDVVFVVIGSDFDRNTALLQPVTKSSASTLFTRQGLITHAELGDLARPW